MNDFINVDDVIAKKHAHQRDVLEIDGFVVNPKSKVEMTVKGKLALSMVRQWWLKSRAYPYKLSILLFYKMR